MMRRLTQSLVAGLILAVPAAGSAQSLFSARGLGLPVAPVDARARALGGIGVGLLGFNSSLTNPAEAAGLGRRGVAAALQPSSGSAELGDLSSDFGGTRFPLLRVFYPVSPRLTVDLGYGGWFEQSWATESTGTEVIGGESVDVRDIVESIGGIAQVRLGVAYWLSPRVAVGAAAGLYTGNLDRRVRRSFADSLVGYQPFDTRYRWEYRAPLFSAGVRVDPAPGVRVGAAATLGGSLDIDNVEGAGGDAEASLPLRVTAGASALLSSVLLATAGAEWASTDAATFEGADALANEEARASWRIGGGLEYQGLGTAARTFPLRLGGQYAQLPYYQTGEEPATEWTASAGIGFLLAGDAAAPAAVADIGFERGRRSGLATDSRPELSESFWRFTFSIALFSR